MVGLVLVMILLSPTGLCLFPFGSGDPWNYPMGTMGDQAHRGSFPVSQPQSRMNPLHQVPRRIHQKSHRTQETISQVPFWTRPQSLRRPPSPPPPPPPSSPMGVLNQRLISKSRMPFDKGYMAPPRGVLEVLPKAISQVRRNYARPQATTTTTTTTEPPVIWFPNQQAECEQESGGGGGFSTFSLLALLMSATNLVGIMASNANNNINNNNNDDNINNNNVQDANENNANNNADIFTMVTFAAGKKRRRRRRDLDDVSAEGDDDDVEKKMEARNPQTEGSEMWQDGKTRPYDEVDGDDVCWLDDTEEVTAEEISAVMSMSFVRASVQASLTNNFGCLCRSLCVANAHAGDWGDMAQAIAQALSEAHVEVMWKRSPEVDTSKFLDAGKDGRTWSDRNACLMKYECPEETWNLLDDDQAVMETVTSSAYRSAMF